MQAKLTINELHQIKWLIGGVLTLISLWALSDLDLLGSGLNLAVITITGIALLKPRWVHSIPETFWVRFVVPLILVMVLLDFAVGFTSLVSPLMRMVTLLILYRALAPRNRREDLQMLLLCLFSIIVSGAITVSLLFAVQILLFAPIAMVFLLIVCLLDGEPESKNYLTKWDQFSFKKLIQHIWYVLDLRAFLLCGLLFAFVVLLSAGVFILIPRFELGQTIPFMQMETKPRSGFSDTVSLNSVSEIIEDQSVALRIDVPDIDSVSSLPYWRILALDRYEDGEFRLSKELGSFRSRRKLRELSGWVEKRIPLNSKKGEQWTFYFEGGVSQYLPLPALFQTIRFTKEYEFQLLPDLYVIGLDSVQRSTFSYQIENLAWNARTPASSRENKQFNCYSNGCDHVKEQMASYPLTTLNLGLQETDRLLLTKLNAKLTDNAAVSTSEYSERVISYLSNNFRYSLEPDGIKGAGDPIVSWLDSGSTGHCELYAGAFVLLAREAGYPARMVVGFAGGSWNSIEDFFVVRNSDAHAWAEIYDPESKEWLRVDPTPGNGSAANPSVLETVNFEFEIEAGMWAWVDSLRMQWYRRVISFDQDDQITLASSLVDMRDSILDTLSKRFEELYSELKGRVSNFFSYKSLLSTVLVLGLCFGLYQLWRILFIGSNLFSYFSRKPNRLDPVRKQASLYMDKVKAKMNHPDLDELHLKALQNLHTGLEALRFGPKVSYRVAVTQFKAARRVLRRRG